jgi:hypothetical protein
VIMSQLQCLIALSSEGRSPGTASDTLVARVGRGPCRPVYSRGESLSRRVTQRLDGTYILRTYGACSSAVDLLHSVVLLQDRSLAKIVKILAVSLSLMLPGDRGNLDMMPPSGSSYQTRWRGSFPYTATQIDTRVDWCNAARQLITWSNLQFFCSELFLFRCDFEHPW